MPKRRSRPLRAAAISIVLVVLAAAGVYLVYHHVTVTGSGCEVDGRQSVGLDTEQAEIATTIVYRGGFAPDFERTVEEYVGKMFE